MGDFLKRRGIGSAVGLYRASTLRRRQQSLEILRWRRLLRVAASASKRARGDPLVAGGEENARFQGEWLEGRMASGRLECASGAAYVGAFDRESGLRDTFAGQKEALASPPED